MTPRHDRTVAEALAANRGIAPGFDFLRLFLALAVVAWHGFKLPRGAGFAPGALADALSYLIVPSFFALSGFLVAGSMLRTRSVPLFLAFRVLRIVPALGVEITLSALILGPLVTTLALGDYVTDPEFARYFTNIVGVIRYRLPGVFIGNPESGIVNGQLWTIPSELLCYIALALLMLTRIAYHRWLMLGVFLLLALAETATGFLPGHQYTPHVLNARETLVLCFLCGCTMCLWADRIRLSPAFVAVAALVYAAVYVLAPVLVFLPGVVAITYATVYAGMQRIPRVPLLMRGDLSYGIYLYGFPIQQAVIWAFPGLRTWYWNLVIATPLAIGFAACSWFWLEKPALALRRFIAPRVRPGRPLEVQAEEGTDPAVTPPARA